MTAMLRQRGALASRLLTDAVRGEDWMDQALCRPGSGVELDLFHDERKLDAARLICESCPVAGPCRRFGEQSGDDWGVYGGTTPAERRSARLKESRIVIRTCRWCRRGFPTQRANYCSGRCRSAASWSRHPEFAARRREQRIRGRTSA